MQILTSSARKKKKKKPQDGIDKLLMNVLSA